MTAATTERTREIDQELLAALKIARKYVVDLDSYLARFYPDGRITWSDLAIINAAIEKAEG